MTYWNLMRLIFSSMADVRLYRLTISSWMSFQPVVGLYCLIFGQRQFSKRNKANELTSHIFMKAHQQHIQLTWPGKPGKLMTKMPRRKSFLHIILSIHEVMCFKREKIDFLFWDMTRSNLANGKNGHPPWLNNSLPWLAWGLHWVSRQVIFVCPPRTY